MRYDGWDTHNNEIARIGNNLEDLFGASGGLARRAYIVGELLRGSPAARDHLKERFMRARPWQEQGVVKARDWMMENGLDPVLAPATKST